MALKNVGLLWERHRHWFYIKTASKTKMTQHLDEEQVNRNHTMPSNKQGRFLCTGAEQVKGLQASTFRKIAEPIYRSRVNELSNPLFAHLKIF